MLDYDGVFSLLLLPATKHVHQRQNILKAQSDIDLPCSADFYNEAVQEQMLDKCLFEYDGYDSQTSVHSVLQAVLLTCC